MADIELVIKIPKEDYEYIKDEWNIDNAMVQSNVIASIMNGTPLPKGDAISRQYLLDNCVMDNVTMPYVPINKIQDAPTIIEADGE